MKKAFGLPLAMVAAVALGACSDSEAYTLAPEVEAPSEKRGATPADRPAQAPGQFSIAQIAGDAGFTVLVDALVYVDGELDTGLVDLFSTGTDQYTVFAPTNEAFVNLLGVISSLEGFEDVDELTDLPAEVVLDVLLYHVIEGRRASNSVVPKRGERTIETLLGETFAVQTDLSIEDGLPFTDADIAVPLFDISASNGIIHAVDEVLVPTSVVELLTQ